MTNKPEGTGTSDYIDEVLSKQWMGPSASDHRVEYVIPKQQPRPAPDPNKEDVLRHLTSIKQPPAHIKAYLDERVISQESAKRSLAVGIAYHIARTVRTLAKELSGEAGGNPIKKNILLIGPTGCGKTYSIEKIAEYARIPLVKEDITKFTSAGYVGRDVEDIAADLIAKAEGNLALAQAGIVYLDEIDKIAQARHIIGKDVNRLEVQQALLKMLEGSEIVLQAGKHLGRPSTTFNTRHVLFVASGAFPGLKSNRGYVSTSDLEEYGFIPEFVGRFPVRVPYDPLSRDDLVRIMKESKESPLGDYIADMADWDIQLMFDEPAIEEIAARAASQGLGARGIVTALEDMLAEPKYNLPGKHTGPVIVRADSKNRE